ncbi:tRNA(m5U54)methyltransferase, partial [Linderina macrospora]
MPEQTDTNPASAPAGIKRAASPTALIATEATQPAAAATADASVSKRAKSDQENKKGKRRTRILRKSTADDTVLEAIQLLLETKWKECHPDSTDLPAAFGWPAGDKQKEALFCRAPPIPAKLAGHDESECELDVYVHEVSEKGMGIATRESADELREIVGRGERPWFLAVPFTLKGEMVRSKTVKHEWGYSQADLLSVTEKSSKRVEPPCKYFGRCSGCQIQHLDYADQLEFKHQVVERAFTHANPLFASVSVSPVWKSPLKLGYRTKLTPHFDIRKDTLPDQVAIGFGMSGQRRVLDIEECIIGTDVVQQGMTKARADTKAKMASYERGATLLIRETYEVP